MTLPYLSAEEVERRLDVRAAMAALEAALADGFDPETDPSRQKLELGGGELLVMSSAVGAHAAVKLVTVGGHPRIQGICVLFDGSLVSDSATVVAIGSHQPNARETDDALARRATVVVESRTSALREAGDVLAAIAAGALAEAELVTLAELVRGEAAPDRERPRLFKSTGMAWEDAVVAAALAGLG